MLLYNLIMDNAVLTLGDMLTFVGLIVAALALVKPRYTLIWHLSRRWMKIVAVVILAIGYILPLAAMLVPDTSNYAYGLTRQAFVQACGFVIITLGLTIVAFIFSGFNYRHLLTRHTQLKLQQNRIPKKKWRNWHIQLERRAVIARRSARKFYATCSIYLMRGHYEEVAEIVRMNMKPLVMSASQYNRYWNHPRPDQPEGAKPPKESGSNYSFELLYQLLTDKAFMKHVVTSDRFFIHAIVEAELDSSEHSYNNDFASILYPELLSRLMHTRDSFLYTEKETHTGSARFANVYDLLTHDNITSRQRIIPSQMTWEHRKTDVPDDEYTEVIITLLERMIDSYKAKPGSSDLLDNIRMVLKGIAGNDGIVRYLAYDQLERKAYGETGSRSNVSNVLLHIHTAFSSRLLFNGDDPKGFTANKAELASKNHESIYDADTLTELLAHAIYDLIEDYTVLFRDTDEPDKTLRRETQPFFFQSRDKPLAVLFEKLLWERMFDKAVKGKLEIMTNIEGYYPNMLRFIIGYFVPFDSVLRLSRLSEEITELQYIMSHELKDALLAGKKMTSGNLMKDELLPSNVKVSIRKNKTITYYYINSKGKKRTINLDRQLEAPTVEQAVRS